MSKRSSLPFRRGILWRYIKAHPGSRRYEIAAGAGLPIVPCGRILSFMREAGLARFEGPACKARWFAVGKQAPVDMRGLSPGTQQNLTGPLRNMWMVSIPAALAARGITKQANLLKSQGGQSPAELVRERAPAKSVSIPTLADLASSLICPP